MVRPTRLAQGHRGDRVSFIRDWQPDAPPPPVKNLRRAGMQPYELEGMVALSIIVSVIILAVTSFVIGTLSWLDGRDK